MEKPQCHDCMKKLGYERKEGFITSQIKKCPGCGKHKLIVAMRYWYKK